MKKFFFPVQYVTQKYLYAEAETFDEAYDIVNKFINNVPQDGILGVNDDYPSGEFHILRCDKNENAVNFSFSYEKLKKMNEDDDGFYQEYPNNKRVILSKDRVENNDPLLNYIWGEKEHFPELS